jgi:DHA2 family multidrug resistance protein
MSAAAATHHEYPAAGRGMLTVVLAMANFMQVLDLTIANVSLPAITSDLGAVPSQGAWIITSYAVANAIGVPLTGWLSDRFGQVRMFTFATLLFGLASLLCGLAWSMPVLISCRLMQGVGAGFMVPLSQALLMRAYPPEKQGTALTIWSMTTVVGPIVGPLLGGWITDNAHWSWIFLINVPVALICAFGVWELLGDRETPLRRAPLDRVGMLLLMIWVGSLQLMLDKGNELDWFSSPFIVALAIAVVLGFLLFLIWELTDAHPVVDLTLFRERNFTLGILALSTMFMSFMAMNLIATLWLQTELGYTAQSAGWVSAHGGVLTLLFAPIVGRYVHLFDPRKVASFGLAILAGSAFLRAHFNSNVDMDTLIVPQMLMGFAGAFIFVPLIGINMGKIPVQRLAAASSMQNFMRTMFGSFGTSLAVAIWSRREALHHSHLAEHANTFSPAGGEFSSMMRAMGLPPEQGWSVFDRFLGVQSYTLSANDVSMVAGFLLLLCCALVWGARPPFRRVAGPVAMD